MKISFNFLSKPLTFEKHFINTLCIENPTVFSETIRAFRNGNIEEHDIIFSENFSPIKAKHNIEFIYDYYDFNFSSSFMKKIYEDMELFCIDNLTEKTVELKNTIFAFLDKVNENYDFDFTYNIDFNFIDFFKSQAFRPLFDGSSLIENLLDYILLVQKYTSVKCFVLLVPSLYFTEEDLNLFYKEIIQRRIYLLVIEGNLIREKNNFEKLTILDKDLCEIVENN